MGAAAGSNTLTATAAGLSGSPVTFTAYAFNEDRVKSETARSEFVVPPDVPLRKPKAYVVTVGVNSHDDPDRDLDFAAKDARDLGVRSSTS